MLLLEKLSSEDLKAEKKLSTVQAPGDLLMFGKELYFGLNENIIYVIVKIF